jgi:hypothetical protein
MTRELIGDLRKAYVQVKDALKRFEKNPGAVESDEFVV